MARDCFCGCGAQIPFGRRAAANAIGRQITADLIALREASDGTLPATVDRTDLERLCYEGDAVLPRVRARTHGEIDRDEIDRDTTQAFMSAARRMRAAITRPAALKSNAPAPAPPELIRATGEVVEIRETGMTINDDPRVRLRLRVFPPSGEPFEVERKLLVSRLSIPRRGDRVEVEYDRNAPDRFTFELTAPTPGLADELTRLTRLHQDGTLTEAEFQRAKAAVLGGEPGPGAIS